MDALVLVDVVQRFDHEDGDALLASYRDRLGGMRELLDRARAAGVPVVYMNDVDGRWTATRRASSGARSPGAAAATSCASSRRGRATASSSSRATRSSTTRRSSSEMCVIQSAIDARELGFKVTIVADACATTDEELERLTFEYAQRVVGARIESVADLRPGRA